MNGARNRGTAKRAKIEHKEAQTVDPLSHDEASRLIKIIKSHITKDGFLRYVTLRADRSLSGSIDSRSGKLLQSSQLCRSIQSEGLDSFSISAELWLQLVHEGDKAMPAWKRAEHQSNREKVRNEASWLTRSSDYIVFEGGLMTRRAAPRYDSFEHGQNGQTTFHFSKGSDLPVTKEGIGVDTRQAADELQTELRDGGMPDECTNDERIEDHQPCVVSNGTSRSLQQVEVDCQVGSQTLHSQNEASTRSKRLPYCRQSTYSQPSSYCRSSVS